jgi:hypothetical protein
LSHTIRSEQSHVGAACDGSRDLQIVGFGMEEAHEAARLRLIIW